MTAGSKFSYRFDVASSLVEFLGGWTPVVIMQRRHPAARYGRLLACQTMGITRGSCNDRRLLGLTLSGTKGIADPLRAAIYSLIR